MDSVKTRTPLLAKLQKSVYRHFLKDIHLFSEFSDQALREVLTNAQIKQYKKGSILFTMGDNARYFFIIMTGWVKLYRYTRDGHEAISCLLTHHDVFGKTSILNKGIYAYTAEAVADVEMLLIPAAFMLKMAEDKVDFYHFIGKFLEAELNEFNQLELHAEHLTQMTSAQRVGCFLLRLCGTHQQGILRLQFPYEKTLVAGQLGMTPETFSRSLNKLANLGVEVKNSVVIIHEVEQLCAHVCEHCSAMCCECPLGKETETTQKMY